MAFSTEVTTLAGQSQSSQPLVLVRSWRNAADRGSLSGFTPLIVGTTGTNVLWILLACCPVVMNSRNWSAIGMSALGMDDGTESTSEGEPLDCATTPFALTTSGKVKTPSVKEGWACLKVGRSHVPSIIMAALPCRNAALAPFSLTASAVSFSSLSLEKAAISCSAETDAGTVNCCFPSRKRSVSGTDLLPEVWAKAAMYHIGHSQVSPPPSTMGAILVLDRITPPAWTSCAYVIGGLRPSFLNRLA